MMSSAGKELALFKSAFLFLFNIENYYRVFEFIEKRTSIDFQC